MFEKIFHLKEHNTNVRTECIAGVTTFMTMAYILAVNPSILSSTGMNPTAVLLATCLASFLGTMCMGMMANLPFALSAGMGLNAFFAYTVCGNMGYPWQVALLAVFVEGIVFIVLSLTNVREALFNVIPLSLKKAVSVGIGVYIAFIGLQNAGVVVNSDSTLVTVVSFTDNFRTGGICALLAIIGTLFTAFLYIKRVKGSILIGILAGYVAAFVMGLVLPTTGVTADGVEFTKAWVLNWNKVAQASWFAIPKLMPVKIVFDMRAIMPVMIMFVVTAVETVGDISGVMEGGMNREPTDKELSGGVAVIKVGAATEVEMKEKKLRIEDALSATKAAVEEGIVAGGGTALINAIPAVEKLVPSLDGDEKTGAKIVLRALEAPLRQIAANAGLEGSIIVDKIRRSRKVGYGFDAYNETYCDMMSNGIVDPTKVTRSALQNAASIASMVLTTESAVANIPKEEPAAAAPAAGGMGGMY